MFIEVETGRGTLKASGVDAIQVVESTPSGLPLIFHLGLTHRLFRTPPADNDQARSPVHTIFRGISERRRK
jgi:hypothetical protein